MTTHRLLPVQAWAYVTPEASRDTNAMRDVGKVLAARCRKAAAARGLTILDGKEVVHQQWHIVPVGDEHPSKATAWVEGDIIPTGWHRLLGVQITLQAYDPQEHQ